MAAASRGTPAAVEAVPGLAPPNGVAQAVRLGAGAAADAVRAVSPLRTVAHRLFEEGYAFDFFQAVRLLERLDPSRFPVGRDHRPLSEAVRFRAHQSLSFPASSLYDIHKPASPLPMPAMVVCFLGLTGPSGILPRHYTELLLRLERDLKGPEKHALRDWLDLFNHRLISLFYRAWEKYRFPIAYERGEYDEGRVRQEGGLEYRVPVAFERGERARKELDSFTCGLFSLIGLGLPPLRSRLRVSVWEETNGEARERILARIDDLALLYYAGFLSHRPRCAVALEAMLRDYFRLPIQVRQFQGQWLRLEPASQSRMGGAEANNQLGVNLVAGERVWGVQSKIRVRLGPLSYARFSEFIPDRSPVPQRKSFFLLAHLIRLYVGPELDFDVQLVLKAAEVPDCRLIDGPAGPPRLGWNTWVCSQPLPRDAADAVFEGEEVYNLNAPLTT
jgi:type VI secretion system protein ImpH